MTHPHALLSLTREQVRRFRIVRSGLLEQHPTPEAASARLFGIQAQIEPAAALALWNRVPQLTYADFTSRLYHRRTLVKLWGQRGTLHVYASDDWPLLHGARAINRTWWERQADDPNNHLEDYRHRVESIAEVLRSRDTMGRSDLRALNLDLPEELYSGWGGIFADLVRLGHACHAERKGGEARIAHRERWLPGLMWNPPDPERANIELVRRFFATYGPATAGDFSHWRGISLKIARRWLASPDAGLTQVHVEGVPMLAATADLEQLAMLPDGARAVEDLPLRLLFRFDPLLLGHRDKSWACPEAHYKAVWRPAGHIEGIVLHRGMAAATWRYERKKSGLAVGIVPFARLPDSAREDVERVAAAVARFFGLALAELRYPDAPD